MKAGSVAHRPRNRMARPQVQIMAPAITGAKRSMPASGRKFTPALASRTTASIVATVITPNLPGGWQLMLALAHKNTDSVLSGQEYT